MLFSKSVSYFFITSSHEDFSDTPRICLASCSVIVLLTLCAIFWTVSCATPVFPAFTIACLYACETALNTTPDPNTIRLAISLAAIMLPLCFQTPQITSETLLEPPSPTRIPFATNLNSSEAKPSSTSIRVCPSLPHTLTSIFLSSVSKHLALLKPLLNLCSKHPSGGTKINWATRTRTRTRLCEAKPSRTSIRVSPFPNPPWLTWRMLLKTPSATEFGARFLVRRVVGGRIQSLLTRPSCDAWSGDDGGSW